MLLRAFFILLPLLYSLNGYAIGSGELVTPDQFEAKSTVLVYWKPSQTNPNGGQCSGVLVARNIVMTAAHCLSVRDLAKNKRGKIILKSLSVGAAADVFVHFGNVTARQFDLNLTRLADDLQIHPDFMKQGTRKENLLNRDIALIKLSQPAPASFVPVKWLKDPKALHRRQTITIAGYGNIYALTSTGEDDPREPAERTLRKFETMIRNPRNRLPNYTRQIQLEWSRNLPRYKNIFEHASQEEQDTIDQAGELDGDSGGPAFVMIKGEPFVAGIASSYDSDNYPVYENVTNDVQWIDKTIEGFAASGN